MDLKQVFFKKNKSYLNYIKNVMNCDFFFTMQNLGIFIYKSPKL